MEHQALPSLREVAATLQKLGLEHERQLSELRRQVELLQTQRDVWTPSHLRSGSEILFASFEVVRKVIFLKSFR